MLEIIRLPKKQSLIHVRDPELIRSDLKTLTPDLSQPGYTELINLSVSLNSNEATGVRDALAKYYLIRPMTILSNLKVRGEPYDGALLMNMKFSYLVKFPFNPSNIRLEEIEIPEVLNLPMLKKI
ncbi:hypothetical protein LSTR_LSTR006261 [Laodelphax striatellus]|uniref:Uncharacterized protein n=1 Tax=Laodelphax striatellus TaxID=195883 RepID=A0A482WHM5_LAOST|nr:hypothetical protein LSTR_LSTR006261 [Laodelphax striatellus]